MVPRLLLSVLVLFFDAKKVTSCDSTAAVAHAANIFKFFSNDEE